MASVEDGYVPSDVYGCGMQLQGIGRRRAPSLSVARQMQLRGAEPLLINTALRRAEIARLGHVNKRDRELIDGAWVQQLSGLLIPGSLEAKFVTTHTTDSGPIEALIEYAGAYRGDVITGVKVTIMGRDPKLVCSVLKRAFGDGDNVIIKPEVNNGRLDELREHRILGDPPKGLFTRQVTGRRLDIKILADPPADDISQ